MSRWREVATITAVLGGSFYLSTDENFVGCTTGMQDCGNTVPESASEYRVYKEYDVYEYLTRAEEQPDREEFANTIHETVDDFSELWQQKGFNFSDVEVIIPDTYPLFDCGQEDGLMVEVDFFEIEGAAACFGSIIFTPELITIADEFDTERQLVVEFAAAHEMGHIAQQVAGLGIDSENEPIKAEIEHQADCYAGELLGKTKHPEDISNIGQFLVSIGNAETVNGSLDHGTGSQREQAFMIGVLGGNCVEITE